MKALWPCHALKKTILAYGVATSEQGQRMYEKVQTMMDMGATMVSLNDEEYEYLETLHLEREATKSALEHVMQQRKEKQ